MTRNNHKSMKLYEDVVPMDDFESMRKSRDEWRSVVLDRCASPDDPETVGAHLAQVDGKDRALEAANKALHARHAEDCETVRMLWAHVPTHLRKELEPELPEGWKSVLAATTLEQTS
jgi:hypothetical protein